MAPFRRVVAAVVAACVFGTSMPVLAAPQPAPSLITTEEATGHPVQQRVAEMLTRDEVRVALAARGVDPAQVEARVAALTPAEAQQLADQLDRAPAGASSVLGVLFAVFIILLVTDILGLTKIFPFTRPVR